MKYFVKYFRNIVWNISKISRWTGWRLYSSLQQSK